MSKIFVPCRGLGYVSNHIPLQVRYIKSRKENLIVTCVGKGFHTYGISHFGLLSVSGLHPDDINCMTTDSFHVYTSCGNEIYAWRRGTELKHVYKSHKQPVHLMLPFGAHLLSVDEASTMIVWDIKDETVFLELKFDNKHFQITTLLHPSTYINKVLLGSDQGKMQLWNIRTAKLVFTFKGWNAAITCLEQAPALNVVAVGLSTGKIILHNLMYDETIMEVTQDWGLVTSISFRTDGSHIMATGSRMGHIVFWDLDWKSDGDSGIPTGRVASQLLSAHDGSVTGMVCLPNEPLLLTSSPDNTLKLWIFDLPDGGARLLKIREGHSSPPSFVRFHGANGHNILSAAGDSTLRIFNTQTEQFNKSLGKASYNRKVSKKRGRAVEDPLKMPPIVHFTSEVTREKEWDNIAAIHSDLAQVTTWSYDKVKMGNLKLLPERFHSKKSHPDVKVAATCLCMTHCGNFVIVGYNTGHVDRFNIQSGIWRTDYGNPKAHEGPVRGVATDSLNQITISGGSDSKIKFWHFKNRGTHPTLVLPLEEPVNFFRTHHESSMLAIATEDFNIHVLDIETRRVIRKFSGHQAQITDITFSPDSRWLISASMDCTIKTWDILCSQLVDHFATDVACISLNMSPTGEALATAHVNYLGIFLWSNKTLYQRVTLKSLPPSDAAPIVTLPECAGGHKDGQGEEEEVKVEDEGFLSREQISEELITLSGLPSSRWQHLLNIETIRQRNKPKSPPKKPISAPFFLPTVTSVDFQFDLSDSQSQPIESGSRLLTSNALSNLSSFGRALEKTQSDDDFVPVIARLKSLGPLLIDFEIKSLSPDGGGNIDVMVQFLKCIEWMLKSNRDFELAGSCLGVFVKEHGRLIATEKRLTTHLVQVNRLHADAWDRLRDKMMYNICVLNFLKSSSSSS